MQQLSSKNRKIIQKKKRPMNAHVRDLFLAQDMEHVKMVDGYGNMVGINMGLLHDEAAVFISHLGSLGVDSDDLPEASELAEAWRQF